MKLLMRYFFQGLMFLLPLTVTAAVIYWLFVSAERVFRVPFQLALPDSWYIPGMGLILAVAFTIVIGMLVKNYFISALLNWIGRRFKRVPLVNQIYGGVRDLLRFFSDDSNNQL
ncbi:MAG: DUF502 domain-containing protein, partial [Pseudohongiellaceae bacterium]